MPTGVASLYDRTTDHITLDRQAGYLAALLTTVAALTVWLTRWLTGAGWQPETPANVGGPDATAAEAAGTGAAWAGLEVLTAAGLLVAILVYRRLPEWLQTSLRFGGVASLFLYLGGQWGAADALATGWALVMGIILIYKAADAYDVWWLINNVLSVLIAIWIGAYLAYLFGVFGLGVALLALTVYDHVFANERSWMFDLADAMLRVRLPIVFLKPHRLRFDWARLYESGGDTGDDAGETDASLPDSAWALGTADLALPAAFAAAVAVAPVGGLVSGGVWAAIAVIGGVAVAALRLRWELLNQGSGAGLPALSTGALGGFAIAQAIFVTIPV
jgi:presenilin-like A22 family membrane protease